MNPLYMLHALITRAYRFTIWSHRETSNQLQETEHTIMSAISEFAAKQAAYNARLAAAVAGITGDVQNLSAQIAALQASSGVLTAEDQALLDGLQAQTESLVEFTAGGRTALVVDRENGVIKGVKILGLESANGRSYRPAALQKAKGLYEGAMVNVDHPAGKASDPRRYADRLGHLEGVEQRADGLYGNLHFNPKHAVAEQLAWDAEHAPLVAGAEGGSLGAVVVFTLPPLKLFPVHAGLGHGPQRILRRDIGDRIGNDVR